MKKRKSVATSAEGRRVELGRYIVADPAICHGRVTFKGTRVFVADVLEDVERGLSWEFILRRWGGGKIRKEAIAEAVHLARNAWLPKSPRSLSVRSLPAMIFASTCAIAGRKFAP